MNPRTTPPRRPSRRRRANKRERGVALVMVMTVIAMITVFVAEMSESTSTSFQVAVSERDRLRAEYIARSGMNLTRLLIGKERDIRNVVAPLYQLVLRRNPPQLNVWTFADEILAPFADPAAAQETGMAGGIDMSQMQGIKDIGGSFEVTTIPENSMLNLNSPLFFDGDEARKGIAMQLYALLGGFQLEGPYDAMFNKLDADGQMTTRLDIVSNIVDWWDYDEQRTVFDPGTLQVSAAGGEDDIYTQFVDPYTVKNAPYDSLEELRLIRGVSDDFWATFVEPDPEDPKSRRVTIYGSGAVNPNEARPEVLLARVCSFVSIQPLCQDPIQALTFIQLISAARSALPIPLFSTESDFLNFMEGKGGGADLYPMLTSFLTAENPLLAWTPIVIPADKRKQMERAFITQAAIFTIQSVGYVGRARVRIRGVVNFDRSWVPPAPNPGTMPGLGVFHHYRID
jgi:general secretion pathway protein K